jgi:thioredoxin-related protein
MHLNTDAQSLSLPEINITQANGEKFTTQQIPTGKAIALIYFSPECEHCQSFMKSFFKEAAKFKDIFVLMITYLPLDRVVKFSEEYPVADYPNIVAGTEGMAFLVRDHFKIDNIPFLANYDKVGKLISTYDGNPSIEKLKKDLNIE